MSKRAPLTMNIGGVNLEIFCKDPAFCVLIRDRYEGFLGSCARSSFCYSWDLTPEDTLLPGSERVPEVELSKRGYYIQRRDFQVEVDFREKRVQGQVARSMYSFDSLLRVFFSVILLELEGLLVHSAGVSRFQQGYLFIGPSGAGKTTLARLSEGYGDTLSDELSLIRRTEEGWRVFGTPFWGELQKNGRNQAVPLKTAFILTKDTRVYTEKLSPGIALSRLLSCVLFFCKDEDSVTQVVDIASRLVQEVPFLRLHFRKDDTFWRVIHD